MCENPPGGAFQKHSQPQFSSALVLLLYFCTYLGNLRCVPGTLEPADELRQARIGRPREEMGELDAREWSRMVGGMVVGVLGGDGGGNAGAAVGAALGGGVDMNGGAGMGGGKRGKGGETMLVVCQGGSARGVGERGDLCLCVGIRPNLALTQLAATRETGSSVRTFQLKVFISSKAPQKSHHSLMAALASFVLSCVVRLSAFVLTT